MLNITSIKSQKEPELKTYKMVIALDPNILKTDCIIHVCVIQGVVLEYTYSHDYSLIPIEPTHSFCKENSICSSIEYNFKANLAVLEDLAEHIRILCYGIDSVTIYPLDVEEN